MQSPPGRVRSVLGLLAREFTEGPLWKNRKVASRGTWAQEPARAPQSSRPTSVDYVPPRTPNHTRLCITTGCQQVSQCRRENMNRPALTHMALCAKDRLRGSAITKLQNLRSCSSSSSRFDNRRCELLQIIATRVAQEDPRDHLNVGVGS